MNYYFLVLNFPSPFTSLPLPLLPYIKDSTPYLQACQGHTLPLRAMARLKNPLLNDHHGGHSLQNNLKPLSKHSVLIWPAFLLLSPLDCLLSPGYNPRSHLHLLPRGFCTCEACLPWQSEMIPANYFFSSSLTFIREANVFNTPHIQAFHR